jgi:hypothetical protein
MLTLLQGKACRIGDDEVSIFTTKQRITCTNRDTIESRNCCIEGIERKGNKEDIAAVVM